MFLEIQRKPQRIRIVINILPKSGHSYSNLEKQPVLFGDHYLVIRGMQNLTCNEGWVKSILGYVTGNQREIFLAVSNNLEARSQLTS